MKKTKQIVRVFFLLLILTLGSGCWDAREVANMAIVAAVGIDLADQPEQLIVTIQVIKPSEVKSGGGGSNGGGGMRQQPKEGQGDAFITVQNSGETVAEAIRKFSFQLNREVYLSHNQLIIFGEAAAKQGIRPMLDYFVRSTAMVSLINAH